MAVASMTGFARKEGAIAGFAWTWELKSVNGRNLDIRCRLPGGYDMLESVARSAAAEILKRGNVNAVLTVNIQEKTGTFRVNETALAQVEKIVADMRQRLDAAPPRVDGILALRGILEVEDSAPAPEELETRLQALQHSLVDTLKHLHTMRLAEGARLQVLVEGHLAEIERLCAQATGIAASQPESLRKRLQEQLAELLSGNGSGAALNEDRLAQEVALLATKADVREELDRLAAHVQAVRDLLRQGGAIGRKLDFLCQEFNREANTLCSKAADLALTTIGIDLKATIEQLREQIQNIE
ncbi:MAG TPA: YicC/YloC family endoribonuclease [Terriglobia bacterium]|nr:YicC/YloC family endoribonuclease [Terriglobia bacterium]